MKIYARQINPEYQENTFFEDFEYCYTEDLIICGNKYFKKMIRDDYALVLEILNDGYLADTLDNIVNYNSHYEFDTCAEAIEYYFNDVQWSGEPTYEDYAIITEVLLDQHSFNSAEAFCKLLTVVTKREWNCKEIYGCAQGDWNNVFYVKSNYSDEALKEIETLYFNLGSEWIVHDYDEIPECAEDIEGYSIYCTNYDEKRFFCTEFNTSADEIVLYKFDGYKRVPKYSLC